ncbi:MAG: acyltransferase [Bacteroidota bacterium]|nr:acyltransferase [Bacteroidota bacterium]
MVTILKYSYLGLRKVVRIISSFLSYSLTYVKFLVFDVEFSSFKTRGIPVIDIYDNGKLIIGSGFNMNNGQRHNMIGRQQNCFFIANNSGVIRIGKNVGISATAIHCNRSIVIGDNVRIGGNTVIYDTDFHSLDYNKRISNTETMADVRVSEVVIEDNVFIGAHSTILKGVTIGKNSIVGAGSVVAKSIPANEIWGGNPVKKIRDL